MDIITLAVVLLLGLITGALWGLWLSHKESQTLETRRQLMEDLGIESDDPRYWLS